MDFGGINSDYSISSLLSVSYAHESVPLLDRQRHHKTQHKKRSATRTSALVIDQLKNGFQRPDDFAPRMRALRNWRPEFLIRYLRDNRCEEERAAVRRDNSRPRSFVPKTPRIYSIGLRDYGARDLSDIDDSRGTRIATKASQDRTRKSAVTTTGSLKQKAVEERADQQQVTVIHGADSTGIPKLELSRRNGGRRSTCDQPPGEPSAGERNDVRHAARGDRAAGDRCFALDSDDLLRVEKDRKHRVTKRDAQIQTSCRRSSSRRRTKGRSSKLTSEEEEEALRRKYDDNGRRAFATTPRDAIAGRRRGDESNASGAKRNEKSGPSIRFLENKRAEYINKFTAVKRQIEEITATLRETCYGDRSLHGNSEKCEKREDPLSTRCDATANARRVSANEDGGERYPLAVAARKEGTPSRGKDVSIRSVRSTVAGSTNDDQNAQRQISRDTNNINDEAPISPGKRYSKSATASTVNPDGDLNVNEVVVRDSVRTFTIKERTLHPWKETPRNARRTKRRFVKQISFDLELTKRDDDDNDDDEVREFSIADKSSDEKKARLRGSSVAPRYERARVLIKDFVNLEEPRGYKRTIEGKVGEIAILKDIKERIDRDFDDRLSRTGENDTEDLLIVSQKGSSSFANDDQNCQPTWTGDTTATEENSSNLDSAETQICDTMSASVLSEYSNRNSTLSRYYSCTQFPSCVSLTRNEDDDRIATVDHRDLNFPPNVSESRRISNPDPSEDLSLLSFNSSVDRPRVNVEKSIPRRDSSARHTWNKSPLETTSESNDTREMIREETTDATREGEFLLDGSDEAESRVHLGERRTADSTLETSKSSRHIGSIDSGVFLSSSLIDLHPRESSFVSGKPELNREREVPRAGKPHRSPPATVDFSSDSTDDSLDRKINDVIEDLTKNLILCERKVKMKLKEMRKADFQCRVPPGACRFTNGLHDAYYDFFDSQSSEDERITDISTPSFLSLSELEVEESSRPP